MPRRPTKVVDPQWQAARRRDRHRIPPVPLRLSAADVARLDAALARLAERGAPTTRHALLVQAVRAELARILDDAPPE